MKPNNFIDTTSDDYYLNPYKYIDVNNKQQLTYINPNKNLNLIIKTLTSIIMSNNTNDEFVDNNFVMSNNLNKLTDTSKSKNIYDDEFIIFKFIANNNIRELKELLSKNNSNSNSNIQDKDGDTPLHIAIFMSNYDACKILVNHGANVFIKDKWGQIPLHRICFTLKNKNTLKIINLFSECNKDTNIFNNVDKYNNTPLHLVLKYILKNNISISKDILSIIQKMLKFTKPNIINDDGLGVKDLIDMVNLNV